MSDRPIPPSGSAPISIDPADVLTVSTESPGQTERSAAPPAVPVAPIRFRRLGVLGTGGMGEVLLYEDAHLGRRVAVKTLRGDGPPRPADEFALLREARIAGRLEHPNIVPVYDVGHDPRRGSFYVMRVLAEPPLNKVLRGIREADDELAARFPLGRLLRLFVQVCRAIEYAHSKGVVHCDLKPANVLVGAFGEVLVVDWGLSVVDGEQPLTSGGTPGYMAPEQVDARIGSVGRRTDVFGLGAILYEILTLAKAFPKATLEDMVERARGGSLPYEAPRAPHEVQRDRAPPALSDVCLHALALAPLSRVSSAGALADEVDAFLEGTKDRARRLARATTLVAQGDELAESHAELCAARPERLRAITAQRASTPAWAPDDEKRALWDAEDGHAVLESLRIRTFQAAVAAFEQALDEVPLHAPARHGLARLYRGEVARAEQRRDELDRVYFAGLLAEYDDDDESASQRLSQLAITCADPAATLVLEHHAEEGRRVVCVREEPLGPAPIELRAVLPGAFAVRADRPGKRSVRVPVRLIAGEALTVEVETASVDALDASEVLVPGGPALLGGGSWDEPARVFVDCFALAAHPVTFAEYLAYLVTLADPAEVALRTPRATDGAPLWERAGADYVPAAIARRGGAIEAWRAWPVFGVTVDDAAAFAAFRARQTGRAYRLPTEAEWEKAARGTDGRLFPWGDRFDASFCAMRDSHVAGPRIVPSDAFPADVSPYGVMGMAGGMADWTAPTRDDLAVARGGAWSDGEADCVLSVRRRYPRAARSSRVGFRLAVELTTKRSRDGRAP